MRDTTITFQLGTHVLAKTALKLECLLLTIEQALDETHPIIHHYALKNIIEIMKLIEKPELKSRFLKELIRIEHSLSKLSLTLSPSLHHNLQAQIQYLSHISGRFGDSIHGCPFLQSIRFSQTGEIYDSDLFSPQLMLWLDGDPKQRVSDLTEWLESLKTLYDTVFVYLSVLRKTAIFDHIELKHGFYQCSLPTKSTCHLILLRMDKHSGFVPKMQLGHHGLSLRLCSAHSKQTVSEPQASVDLAICQL